LGVISLRNYWEYLMSDNRIVVSVQVSLDGRTAGPGGELDWFAVKDELHAHFVTEHSKAGMFLYGRRTYEGMAGYWPTADEDPANDQCWRTSANAKDSRWPTPKPSITPS
jgi:dihydrofolate reductase